MALAALALKLALSPVLATQAVLTRSRLPRLPEAGGPRAGEVGAGPLLRLLVAGDSSAAGVGVADQEQALAAPLARELARHAGRRVRWELLAQSGWTTAQLLARLHELQGRSDAAWDLALIVSGVNDVVDQVASQRAVAAREALVNRLRNAHGVQHVAFAPLPPVHAFPGLPQPLRWIAGADARRHDVALLEWARTRSDVSCVALRFELNPNTMAADGFHPGAPAYAACARGMAAHLAPLAGALSEETCA